MINLNNKKLINLILCGGGRKNKSLLIELKYLNSKKLNIKNIDDYNFNGDFVESQAFGYLAIRSFLKLPISFPNTTRCDILVQVVNFKKFLIKAVSFFIYLSKYFTN